MLALVLADLVDRHDARMVEVRGGLGLDVEPLDVGLGGELAGEDHLERDGAVEAHLPGLVDDAHAAAGDLADELVVAEVADARSEDPAASLVDPVPGRCGLVARGLVARCNGRFLVNRRASLTWNGTRRWLRRYHRRRLGGRTGLFSCDSRLRPPQLAFHGYQFGTQRRASLVGNLGQVRIEWRTGSGPPVGLEPAANGIDLPHQLNVKLARVRGSGSLTEKLLAEIMVEFAATRLATKGDVSSGSNCASFLTGHVTVLQRPEPSAMPSHRAKTLESMRFARRRKRLIRRLAP